jgi:hypothetical protein
MSICDILIGKRTTRNIIYYNSVKMIVLKWFDIKDDIIPLSLY